MWWLVLYVLILIALVICFRFLEPRRIVDQDTVTYIAVAIIVWVVVGVVALVIYIIHEVV